MKRQGDVHAFTTTAEEKTYKKPVGKGIAAVHVPLEEVLDAATQVLISATDVHGTITLFNSGRKMLGYKSSEMVGKRTPEVMHVTSEVEERGKELSKELGEI